MFSVTYVNTLTGKEGKADHQDYPKEEARQKVRYFQNMYHRTTVFMAEDDEANRINMLTAIGMLWE